MDSADDLLSNVPHPEPTTPASLKALWSTNVYFNYVLVLALPLGILAGALKWSDTAVFLINMVAIICLAKMLDLCTDQLSGRLGQALGALINASFGNAVELIVGIIALKEGLLEVVQASFIGSILSNLLLVLGFCFLLGGLKFKQQTFNPKASGTASSLFVLSLFGFMLPAIFALQEKDSVHQMALSHGTAIMLILTYVAFLVFQLVTHTHFYSGEDDEEEAAILTLPVAVGALLISTVLIGITAEFLVGSLEGISKAWGIPEQFVGMILLPVVGNAAEHVTAVYAAMRNKMDLAIGVSLGSSMQISMFVTPLLVLIGWMIGQPLTLIFPIIDVAVLFISILVVNHTLADGESNWLEGLMLLVGYLIIAIAYALL
ncbi:Sodium/calcium exchanger protein-domain-containing protein [Gorgonomyces haynaldii]|nr:Sodium/calcium exchanger protein-domain-containing protein [Gorgonomyces haynaldii]